MKPKTVKGEKKTCQKLRGEEKVKGRWEDKRWLVEFKWIPVRRHPNCLNYNKWQLLIDGNTVGFK
jgi:hypothetical protein